MHINHSEGYEPRFDLDLKVGQQGEKYVAGTIEHIFSANPRIEVKTDRKAIDTGNLYLEFECRGKPSGLATTEADLVAFVIGTNVLIFKADSIRAIMFLAMYNPSGSKPNMIRSLTRGSHPTRGVVYPLAAIIGACAHADSQMTPAYADLLRQAFREGSIHA